MPHGAPPALASTTTALPTSRQSEAIRGSHPTLLGFDRLPAAAVDLILLGDLTGRYATGSYTRRNSRGALVRREDRQGVAEHGHRITAAIACHVARAGGNADQLTRLLLHPDHEGGRHAQIIELRSGQARARAYIERVWASASAEVAATVGVGSRHGAHEDLAALRERIETTPWRGERGRTALRVLRAHLNFAETAGGRLHAASERQTAEEAGISRQTLHNAYETVLKPGGWLRRLRVGHGTEGSTWYLGNGPHALGAAIALAAPSDAATVASHAARLAATPVTCTGGNTKVTAKTEPGQRLLLTATNIGRLMPTATRTRASVTPRPGRPTSPAASRRPWSPSPPASPPTRWSTPRAAEPGTATPCTSWRCTSPVPPSVVRSARPRPSPCPGQECGWTSPSAPPTGRPPRASRCAGSSPARTRAATNAARVRPAS